MATVNYNLSLNEFVQQYPNSLPLLLNENGQLIRQIRVTINPGRVYSFYALGNKPNFQIFQSLDGATFMK